MAVTMPELPHMLGLPSYRDLEYWKPVFDAMCDTSTVMCLHIGQGFGSINTAPGAPIDNMIILATQVSAIAAQDLLWGGAFWNWPEPQGGVVRGRHRVDSRSTSTAATATTSTSGGWGTTSATSSRATSSSEHSLACYISDPASLETRHHVGIDTIAWECDYPHSDSVWPGAPEFLMGEFDGGPGAPTTRSTRSPGRTRPASSTTTRSPSFPRSRPPLVPYGLSPRTWTRRSVPAPSGRPVTRRPTRPELTTGPAAPDIENLTTEE